MQNEKKNKFQKMSDEEISEISGGNVSLVYKKGLWWYVWNPKGKLIGEFLFCGDTIDKTVIESKDLHRPGPVRILTSEEYTMKTEKNIIQKIV